jgi:hypothetical protein
VGEEPGQLKMCSGVSVGNLGANLTAAAVVYEHTTRCLRDFARDKDFGMKRCAASALAKSCTLFVQLQGMLLERPDDPGGVFFCVQFPAVVTAAASGAANAMNAISIGLHQPGR